MPEITETLEKIKSLVVGKNIRELRTLTEDMNDADIADTLEQLEPEERVILFRALSRDMAAEVFAHLIPDTKEALVSQLTAPELGRIVDELFLDDAADLVEELPADVVKRILESASPETRKGINQLLQYQEDSAGSIMTTEYISLSPNMNVEESFRHIREVGTDKETLYTCYVTDPKGVLIGVVTVRTMLLSQYADMIGDIMTDTNLITVNTNDDREKVTELFQKYDFMAIPVVDSQNHLVGIVTVDDAMEVMEEESTEDFHKMAAMLPMDEPYLSMSIGELARKRVIWLMVLMISATFSGAILTHYQAVFAAFPALIASIPMLMDTGGNAGSQSSTLVIRGIAVGELKLRDALSVLIKELRVSLMVGGGLALVNFVYKYAMSGDLLLSVIVGISLFGTVIFAQTVGGMLPLLAKALGFDPALMASPIVTTIVDAGSLTLYFAVASKVMNL
ncbi:MAG: magnesium transporter [Synergistaceae bacterium]|nr:magnesium transporter [Synergistaceae bacterium]MBQ3398468.1 magnesium transporter [Synergistaceae bacterium]MBQ6113995.1 magnesium transporter [Synergistaceae bacterium]MBQ6980878.1 magnesium transporter [Synergistaceae bacterium]MBR0184677.1 magnesium transporter [Synergistaceae bacterium]